jgi:hypothetical protein
MHIYFRPRLGKPSLLLATAALVALVGCASSEALQQKVAVSANEVAKGKAAPFQTVTNFSGAVRCMDAMLVDYGVRDIGILVEDLEDQTKKVSVGTKDMLLSTLSDMTRRSRALRIVAYGGDSKNIVGFLQAAERKDAFSNVPQFDIRGSITQFDDNLARGTRDAGVGAGDWFNVGVSSSSSARMLGLDLNILNTSDLSLVSGVTSKNGVVIFSQGEGVDGEARFKKLGINYSTSFSKSEGNSVAMRNLIELAAVELIGKLTKVPYWKCLGASAEEESVRALVEDWFEGMAHNVRELFTYYQYQLSLRGFYKGPVNGIPSPAFSKAIRDYRAALGLPPTSDLNAEFLMRYLSADHAAIAAKTELERSRIPATPTASAAPAPKSTKKSAAKSLRNQTQRRDARGGTSQ